jgi:lipopolysaccharide export system ATP-binding protein
MHSVVEEPVSGLAALGLRVQRGPHLLLESVSFHIHPGQIVGLLGPNGAGKTTTFRALTGLLPLAAGDVLLNGQPLKGPLHLRIRAGLGYLPQKPSLIEGLNVEQQLQVALEARGESTALAQEFLDRLGVGTLAKRSVTDLSGGEIRRVEIARCLATNPQVLLLDEPFAGLDPKAISTLKESVRELAQSGLGVLITDHAVRETMPLCDRVLLLVQGRVVAQGTPSEIEANPTARSRWLGQDWSSGASPL